MNKNIVLFNTNLTNFIDKTYKNEKEDIDENIKDNKDTINNFINTFTTFSNNISNINTNQNSRLTDLENNKITDSQSNKLTQLEDIDLGKINSSYNFSVFNKTKLDKMRYYISEFIPFNITLVKKFTFVGNVNEIVILQFELDQRDFDNDDKFQFFLNITIQYDISKHNYYRLKLKFDILYDDETLVKQYIKMPISKGLVYHNLMNFNINNFFKLSKKTEKVIFKIYMSKINESLQDNIVFTLENKYENNFCDLIHYKIV